MTVAAGNCTGECLKSGPWGLAIVLLLAVACYFLFRSMSKHMKRAKAQAIEAEQAQRVQTGNASSVRDRMQASQPPADAERSDPPAE